MHNHLAGDLRFHDSMRPTGSSPEPDHRVVRVRSGLTSKHNKNEK